MEINTETEISTNKSSTTHDEVAISNHADPDFRSQGNADEKDELIILQALAAFRPFISAQKLHKLINNTGGIRQAWNTPDEALEQYGWTPEQRCSFNEHRKNYQPEKALEHLNSLGIEFIPSTSTKFPKSLINIFDPPLGLYVRGQLHPNSLNIAFVGSRKATPYGKTVTNMLVRPLAAKGAVIISGLAYGIDAEAHLAALAVHGTTWAVLGNGCDEMTLYPRSHRQLARNIIENDGAIISEYPPGTAAQPFYFPQRNRIVTGFSRAIVVVEAGIKSGALITARLGLEQNREVFAVPGPITSEMSQGTNELIRDGATPVASAEQIIDALELFNLFGGITKKIAQKSNPKKITDAKNNSSVTTKNLPKNEQEKILSALSQVSLTIDEIVKASTLPSHTVASVLTMLEIDGLVKDTGGRNYVRI